MLNCPVRDGYNLDTNSNACFKLVQISMSKSDAQQYCAEDGGRLIRMKSEKQSIAITKYLGKSTNYL